MATNVGHMNIHEINEFLLEPTISKVVDILLTINQHQKQTAPNQDRSATRLNQASNNRATP